VGDCTLTQEPWEDEACPRVVPFLGVIQKVFAVKGYREMECRCVQKYLCSDILKRDVGHRSTEEALRAYRTGQAGKENLFDLLLS